MRDKEKLKKMFTAFDTKIDAMSNDELLQYLGSQYEYVDDIIRSMQDPMSPLDEYEDPCMPAEILVLKNWSAEEKEIIYNHFKRNKEYVPRYKV